ncbi:MAG: nucleotidyltransferase family protein [Bacteroidales bacterium]|nr:nucleotidyltransferase family protein [Bacteroidales bacterium]
MKEKLFFAEDICIRLLKSELWDAPLEIPDDFSDWGMVARIAKKQSVLGIAGNRMLALPSISENLSPDLKSKVKSFIMGNMLMHQKLNHDLLMTKESLEKRNVSPILLKGQGVASCYPNPYLRQCGDIDYYIGESKYEDAYEVFQEIATKIDARGKIYDGKHFHVFIGKTEFDVHRFCGMYSLKSYNRKFQEEAVRGLTSGLTELQINGVSVLTPSIEFNAYYIFNHLLNHFMVSGIGLRHLCDLMMFLHVNHGRLDLDELKRILVRMDVMYPWKLFGGVLVEVLGLPAAEFPFYESLGRKNINRVVRHVLDEGNFGIGTDYYVRNQKKGLGRYLYSVKFHVRRFLRLMFLLPGASMRRMANYLVFSIGYMRRR